MFQTTVKTVAKKSPVYIMTPTEKWDEAVQYVCAEIAWNQPLANIQAAVDFANKRGIACKATAYERREALQGALLRTGYHIDQKNKVGKLSDLISVLDVELDVEDGKPCVRFKVHAQLERKGSSYTSSECFEWLDGKCHIVAKDLNRDVNVEPLVECAHALDTFVTKVQVAVYDHLEAAILALRLQERVSVLIVRASETTYRIVFDLFVDREWGGACVGATLDAGLSKIDGFDDDACAGIRKVATFTGVAASDVEKFVRLSLKKALETYEYWGADAESERSEMERESA